MITWIFYCMLSDLTRRPCRNERKNLLTREGRCQWNNVWSWWVNCNPFCIPFPKSSDQGPCTWQTLVKILGRWLLENINLSLGICSLTIKVFFFIHHIFSGCPKYGYCYILNTNPFDRIGIHVSVFSLHNGLTTEWMIDSWQTLAKF